MKIDIKKFGTILISRPAGREAALAALAYSIPKNGTETIELDFSDIDVLTPSWMDEFLQTLTQQIPMERFNIVEGKNASVHMTMKTIQELMTP
ncbi:MAG TPA: DUF4325 domain-containing protein [Patescibacteria group bacterium]|nr:DUF4325 domain-containing protein [Patescibacteria group bacterium]